jgi:carboxyl-terminal processing protease
MQVKHSRLPLLVIILTLMALSFIVGRQYSSYPSPFPPHNLIAALGGAGGENSGVEDISLKPVEAFNEVVAALRQNYVDGIDAEKETTLTYAAIRGLLGGLQDPYTRFLDPQEFRDFQEENSGKFQGIGATLESVPVPDPADKEKHSDAEIPVTLFRCKVCGADWENPLSYHIDRMSKNGFEATFTHELPLYRQYRVAVVAPIPGGPAEKAGIKPGDQIVKIGDTSTFGMDLNEAVKLIRGPSGTMVNLLIKRKDVSKPLSFSIVRGDIVIPTVESKSLPDGIGYLRINTFNGQSNDKVAEGLKDLRKAGMKALLLDLRNNPGGSLDVCLSVASQLLPSGPIVLIQSKGDEARTESTPKSSQGLGMPLVVLVNGGSASASEILAGALQDRKAAKLVGERTFGKGLVQTVGRMQDGSGLIITTAKYFTPLHHDVNQHGIMPDVQVKQPDSERENIKFLADKDLQAQEGIKLLKSEMAAPGKAAGGSRATSPTLTTAH